MERRASRAKTTRPSAESVLPRARLFSAMDARRRAPVVWVHGPPGCGKTSLVSSYLEARAGDGLWYQVDAGDADPASLCLYLGEAMGGRARGLPLFTAEYRAQPHAFARHFFRRLFAAMEPPFLVVFDNYHELGNDSGVHAMLRDAAGELPAEGALVIISRAPPPAAFIRLRANRELEVLDWDDLRLTRDESDAIVATHLRGAGREPTGEAIGAALYARTGGWAAALILALEQGFGSGAGLPDAGSPPELLFEYLAGEVFSNFEAEVQALLTRTALVEEMSVALARRLGGEPRAGALLDALHRRHQMLSVKQGPDGPVYQCHPLLREYLLARAQRELAPRERAVIAREAATALEDEGAVDAALRLLQGHADADALAGALMRHAARVFAEGRAQTLERWLAALEPERIAADPWLRYWEAACRFQRDPRQAEWLFAAAYRHFETLGAEGSEGRALSAANAMHAIIFALDDLSALDPWITRSEAIDAEGVDGAEAGARLAVCSFMALVFRQPHHPRIGEWAERALDACRSLTDAQLRLSTQLLLAINLNYTGQFARAREFLEPLRKQAERPEAQPLERTTLKAVESMFHMLNAEARPCLRAVMDGLEIADESGVHLWSYQLLSNGVAGALAVGDLDTASELLLRMQDHAQGAGRLDRAAYHHHRAWHASLQGEPDAAWREQRVALALAEEVGCPYYVALCRSALAQILAERRDLERALLEMRRAWRVTRRINNPLLHFATLLAMADVALRANRRGLALAALARGLAVGREHGFRHFLGWRPAAVSRVLAVALEEGVEGEYASTLIRERGLTPPDEGPARRRWPWRITVRTFGGFRVSLNGAAVARLSGRPLALLQTLAGLGGERVEEAVLAGLLWPRHGSEYAHRSLTTALHRLRKLLGEDGVIVLRHGRLTLAPDRCRLDLRALEEVLTRIEAVDGAEPGGREVLVSLGTELLDVYEGPFMEGEPLEAYRALRERLRGRVLGGLDDLARGLERAGVPEQAVAFYRRAIDQDPLAEAFHRRLMLSLRDLGRSALAVEVYANLKSLMLAAVGEPPSAETTAIYEAVRREI
jgi:ATP/maltotriose-dependent transcriptional regulator MalT/DNA-binding SARP family transcriptional activator